MQVNWDELIHSLTGMNMITSENIQVYFHAALVKGLRRLEEYAKEDPMGLNNAIMGLYAHKLYHEVIMYMLNSFAFKCNKIKIHM